MKDSQIKEIPDGGPGGARPSRRRGGIFEAMLRDGAGAQFSSEAPPEALRRNLVGEVRRPLPQEQFARGAAKRLCRFAANLRLESAVARAAGRFALNAQRSLQGGR